ncbi:OapC/ArvC family zinc-ribbon domain-containing protein [Natrinema salsiterrestre]|uniref:Origin-associated protein OapC n=1 Tax=Natrinema salsiterrestre TaxID=2950540 RepID=A0A9Q4L063_9EURY|nr:Zn-ribbon containing protein [Natrinema salsiterrestre]MDF9747383.1 hypothetical protein [Natrinema salsiterrestre]
MPHQCTNCGRTFADGSKEMLSGCPDCGGNKFQFAPTAAAVADSSAEAEGSGSLDADGTAGESTAPESDSVATRAAETVRDLVSGDSSDQSAADVPAEPPLEESAGATQSDAPWPSSEDAPETDSTTSDGEFEEWPETARRPEDRSASSDEAAADAPRETGPTDRTDSEWPPQSSASSGPTTTIADDENSAQANARSEVIPTDDLPSGSGTATRDTSDHGTEAGTDRGTAAGSEHGHEADSAVETPAGADGSSGDLDADQSPDHGRVVSEPSGQRPSLEELRAELNEQFESIKIVSPGQYELNLMELYNRDEYIISLQEDGRYVIDVPDSWRAGDDEDE